MLVRTSCPPVSESTSDLNHIYNYREFVDQRVTKVSRARFKGFVTFEEARLYLENAGHTTFHFDHGPADGPKSSSPVDPDGGKPTIYVVTKGRGIGIQQSYG